MLFNGSTNKKDNETAGNGDNTKRRMPRELLFAAGALLLVLVAMSGALWLVSRASSQGQVHADARSAWQSEELRSSEQLVEALVADLGAQGTDQDLEAAVRTWLQDKHPSGYTSSYTMATADLATTSYESR